MMLKKKLITIVITVAMLSTIIPFISQLSKADEDPDDLIVWLTSDSHGGTTWDDDVSVSGGSWSGTMISGSIDRIDLGIVAGDILTSGSESTYASYVNSTFSCIVDGSMQTNFWDLPADERIWLFNFGNHDADNNLLSVARGCGLDSRTWYNNSAPMGNAWNYSIQRGNLLFVTMGGERSSPSADPFYLETSDYEWFEDLVDWADNESVNIIVTVHPNIFNGTNGKGYPTTWKYHDVFYNTTSASWEACPDHTSYSSGFRDPWWDGSTPGWNTSTHLWDLINTSAKTISMWYNGHIHTAHDEHDPPPHEHGGWDTFLGVERDVQKHPSCTFVNAGGTDPWDSSWSFSRVMKFTNNSKDVLIRSFDHIANTYGSDTGWQSSHQDITITNCLKYSYDPFWEEGETPDPDPIVGETNITSINSQGNDTSLYVENRTIVWEKVDNATQYHLQVDNASTFSDPFIDLNNINLANYGSEYYSENSTHVTFILPEAYQITYYGAHFYRVRAFVT